MDMPKPPALTPREYECAIDPTGECNGPNFRLNVVLAKEGSKLDVTYEVFVIDNPSSLDEAIVEIDGETFDRLTRLGLLGEMRALRQLAVDNEEVAPHGYPSNKKLLLRIAKALEGRSEGRS